MIYAEGKNVMKNDTYLVKERISEETEIKVKNENLVNIEEGLNFIVSILNNE